MSPAPRPKFVPYERRRHQRFPITVPAQFIVAANRGQAMTADISSGGVRLQTELTLPVGRQIQVSIDWPALLDQRCPLRLVIAGRILRSGAEGTAIGIIRYDFRIRSKRATPFAA